VNEWNDVTEEECNRRWKPATGPVPAPALLDMSRWIDVPEGFQDKNISFISYANQNFHQALERIGREAKNMGVFNTVRLYSPDDLSPEFKASVNETLNQPRGGGYWIWKPYVIHDTLSKLNDNEYLLYADAGCTLHKSGLQRLKDYIQTISSDKCIFAMALKDLPENAWTSNAVFKHFGIDNNNDIYKSNQVLAGVSIYRKNAESMAFVKAWLDIAVSKPDLFTDKYNEETRKENPAFKEARHDQSIFSVLIKSEPHRRHAVLFDDEVDDASENRPIKAKRQKN
jgi:hypothetical protein